MASKSWGWVFPIAGFVGYVFAFRRGLLVWSPQGIGVTWQGARGGGWGVGPMTRSAKGPQNERPAARLVRGAFRQGAAVENEGARTCLAVPRMAAEVGVEAPIAEAVVQVLYDGVAPTTAVEALMTRALRPE